MDKPDVSGFNARVREPRIVLLERDDFARELLTEYLVGHGFRVQAETQLDDAVGAFKRGPVPVVVAGIGPGGFPVAELAARIRRASPHTALLAILARDATEDRLRAFRDGALEVLQVPVTADSLALGVLRCLETVRMLDQLPDMRRNVWAYFAARRIQRAPDVTSLARALLNSAHGSTGADAGFALSPTPEGALELAATVYLDADAARELLQAWDPRALPETGDVHRFPSGSGPLAALKGRAAKQATEVVVVRVGPADRPLLVCALLFGVKAARAAELPAAAMTELSLYAAEAAFAIEARSRFADGAEASIDPVTDLYDEPHLLRTLEGELARRRKDGGRLALLDARLDGFRAAEEDHGALVAARVLAEAARLIVRAVRDADVVARTGPDRFGVLLFSADAAGAERIAERIRSTFERHRFLAREGLDLRLTLSIGVAAHPEQADSPLDLRVAAEQALERLEVGGNVIGVAPARAPARRGRGG
jgi:diguanylate cyclase (GGDEF)-like protein